MLTRYLITLGATTTAGGKVTSGSALMSIGEAAVALEGDTIWCPACNTEGVIGLDGPRLLRTVDGREEALGGDLCLCECSPPPRLIAAQSLAWQEIDTGWHAEQVEAGARMAAQRNAEEHGATMEDKLPLILLDPGTQQPLRCAPYRLQLDGTVIEGLTDALGATQSLSAAERAAVCAWQHGRPKA
jgi:uncharacterized Zn-binding protein involved in type VI secretion